MSAEIVRELLLAIWSAQACRNPADWPAVLMRLLEKRSNGYDDGARLDTACLALAQIFGAPQLPADPTMAVWQAWPKLSRNSCDRLAELLIEARDRRPSSSDHAQSSLLACIAPRASSAFQQSGAGENK
jgi:hypothetical protein